MWVGQDFMKAPIFLPALLKCLYPQQVRHKALLLTVPVCSNMTNGHCMTCSEADRTGRAVCYSCEPGYLLSDRAHDCLGMAINKINTPPHTPKTIIKLVNRHEITVYFAII